MLDMYYLYSNQKSKMTKYKTFQSFGQFKTWADNLNDRELMIKILIVEKYQKEIPIILDKINERCRYDPDNADYIFTSTHKVKKILKDRMGSIPSPSPSAKIQILGGIVCLRCKG